MASSKSRYKVLCLAIVLLSACGELQRRTEDPPPSGSGSAGSQSYLVVLGANFTDPIGTLSLVSLTPPREVSLNLSTTHSDAIVRASGGLLYVVNRLGGDNIQVVDPADFTTLSQFSTGSGTNPQEIVIVTPSEVYVTLYQPEDNQDTNLATDDLIRLNPQTGEILGTIDLTPFTADDGDRFARASSLVRVDDDLFVAIQDLPGDLSLPPDRPGKIVRLNLSTGRVEALAILGCRNPFAMIYSPETARLYITCSDFFGLSSPYGGVEIVDPEAMTTEGFIPDNDLGGWIGDIEVSGESGYVVVGTPDYSENRVIRFSLTDPGGPTQTLYTSPSYLQDVAISPEGGLIVGDRDPRVNGVVFVDPETGEVLDGPIAVGAPPASLTFIER